MLRYFIVENDYHPSTLFPLSRNAVWARERSFSFRMMTIKIAVCCVSIRNTVKPCAWHCALTKDTSN